MNGSSSRAPREAWAAAGGSIDGFVDTFGGGYVDLAVRLGVRPERIDTIIDFAAEKKHGVKTEGGAAAATGQVLGEMVGLIRDGKLEVPIAKAFPLDRVQDAYRELERRHTRGKIVLVPLPTETWTMFAAALPHPVPTLPITRRPSLPAVS